VQIKQQNVNKDQGVKKRKKKKKEKE